MDFGPGGPHLAFGVFHILYAGFSLLVVAVLIGLIVLVVRFLLVATKAAQIYITTNQPKGRGNQPPPSPGPAPAPAGPSTAAAPTEQSSPPAEAPARTTAAAEATEPRQAAKPRQAPEPRQATEPREPSEPTTTFPSATVLTTGDPSASDPTIPLPVEPAEPQAAPPARPGVKRAPRRRPEES